MIYSFPLSSAYLCVNCERVISFEREPILNCKCPCCNRGLLVPLSRWLNREEEKEVEDGREKDRYYGGSDV